MSIVKQCELLSVHRSGFYYRPTQESALNLELMRKMDAHYMEHPEKGAKRMHTWLTLDKGYKVSRNRVERLYYKVMRLRATIPGKHTSKRQKGHKVYPYLLRGLAVERKDRVWAIDITYIPMSKGFMYLVAVIDLYSRYVVNWSLSNTMDAEWCRETVEGAIEMHGKPDIPNTDQGAQFTSEVFAGYVLSEGVRLSMDGKGRATDNAFIERLWRSVKYEKVYLNPPSTGLELYEMLSVYFDYYNTERRHQGIDDNIPAEMYLQGAKKKAAA